MPHVTSRHGPSLEVRVVLSRQAVLLLGAPGPGTGSRNQGRLREHQLGLASQCRVTGLGGSCTVSRFEGCSDDCRIQGGDTLPGSELTTELGVCGVSAGCLEVGVRTRAVSISPPWGSGETMGAHLPLKSISDKTRVGRGQKGASRRPQWAGDGPRVGHGLILAFHPCRPSLVSRPATSSSSDGTVVTNTVLAAAPETNNV